jgi:hypothetical protein
MRVIRPVLGALLVSALMAPGAATATESLTAVRQTAVPPAVVALIDTGINPYSVAFRDKSALAYKHPSTYIPGYPKDAEALKLSLDLPYEKAIEKDADTWALVQKSKLYWIPGTRIVGAISFGAGGTNCPTVQVPPANGYLQGDCKEHTILDDHGHGTMTASRAAGSPNSLAPTARIVTIEGLGAKSVEWAADAGWIDVQSNSWVNFVPPPVPSSVSSAFADAATKMLTLAASGNGSAFIAGAAPTPTYLLSTAPPGVILVGGHDNGKMTLWSGAPPHVVADAYAGFAAISNSNEPMRPDPIACCTSAASPYAAGGAIAIIQEARRILGDCSTGSRGGIVATGPAGAVKDGPLADGKFTLDELKDLYLHTAEPHPSEELNDGDIHWAGDPRAPDHTEFGPGANPFCVGCTTMPVPWSRIPSQVEAYPLIGYGGINGYSVTMATAVLRGKTQQPERPAADAQYEADQAIRSVLFAGSPVEERSDLVSVPLQPCSR